MSSEVLRSPSSLYAEILMLQAAYPPVSRSRLRGPAFMRFALSVMVAPGECWLWIGHRRAGYGRFLVNGASIQAHRFAYESCFGLIDEGYELHHICKNKACCNPEHLLPVTHEAHMAVGPGTLNPTCPHGHPYDGTEYRNPHTGHVACRECHRIRQRKRYYNDPESASVKARLGYVARYIPTSNRRRPVFDRL
jgi:hypothetical protein